MGPKAMKSDPLSVVVVLDTSFPAHLSQLIIGNLYEKFSKDGQVKTAEDKLALNLAIQWLSAKVNEMGKKIPNEWNRENFTLIIKPLSTFHERVIFFLETRQPLDDLLEHLLDVKPPKGMNLKIILHDDESDSSAKKTKRSRNSFNFTPAQRDLLEKWAVRCLFDHSVDVCLGPKSTSDVIAEVVRATKSILAMHDPNKKEDMFMTSGRNDDFWIPNKGGKPVDIGKNTNVGLLSLWQHYLLHVSKAVGPEQAKTISSSDGFRSPHETFMTLRNCTTDEGEKVLADKCKVRPTAAANGALAFRGSRPNIGNETSRKFYKIFASLDGNEIP